MTFYPRSGEDIDRGLIGFWKLNDKRIPGATKAIDRANFNDGTITGATNTEGINGLNPDAMFFDGSSDVITMSKFPLIDGDSFSVAAWVYFPQAGGSHTIVSEGTGTAIALDGFHLWKDVANILSLTVGNGSAGVAAKIDMDGLVTYVNRWIHIVGTFNNIDNKARLYINGILQNTSDVLSGGYSTYSANPPLIGRLSYTVAFFFKGRISNVRLYNNSLTDGEISKLYRLRK